MKFNKISTLLLSTIIASANAYDLLKDYAGDLKIGCAANTAKFGNGSYNNAMKAFNMMVAENGCKLSGIQQSKGVYNFNDCDNHYKKAKELGMEFRGHCLIWHAHMPGWFQNADANTLKNAIVDHITKTLQHYEGKIKYWDVVNEAVDDSSNGQGFKLRNSFLRQKVPDFIDLAFQTARKVSPNTKLFYNDYNAEGHLPKSESIYNFVADLKKRNIPIDGVGLQYHVSSQSQPSYDKISGLIGRYCKLGLEVHITELDVKLQGNQNGQTQAYSNALKACLANSCCKAFLVWGVGDNDSWLGANEKALLFDGGYQPKPIYNTLVDILKKNARPATNNPPASEAPANNTPANPPANNASGTKTIPKINKTKTIPANLANGGSGAGTGKTKTIPANLVTQLKTIPAGLGGGSRTKTVPSSLINTTKKIPETISPKGKTIPSNVDIPKTKVIPTGNASGTKTIPKINKTKTIPANLANGGSGSTKTIPANLANGTKTIPPELANGGSGSKTKTIPKINKTKTIPAGLGGGSSTKTIPNINKTKTIPENLAAGTKTIPAANKTKTIPAELGSKTIPAELATKTVPGAGKTKTIPANLATKTVPGAAKTKTIPNINKTKTIPAGNTTPTKTVPASGGSGNGQCEPVTVTVTVTVNSAASTNDANCVQKWGQCGGVNYTGPKCCQSGSTCKEFNEWYSQCI